MANNVTIAGKTFATQDVSGAHHQKVKQTGATVSTNNSAALSTTSGIKVAADANRVEVMVVTDAAALLSSDGTNWFPAASNTYFTFKGTGAIYGKVSSGTATLYYWNESNG